MGAMKIGVIELTITVVLGFALFEFDKPALGEFVWVIGLLFFLHRFIHSFTIGKKVDEINRSIDEKHKTLVDSYSTTHEPLNSLKKFIDLDKEIKNHEINNIRKSYMAIIEPEFRDVKDSIVREAARSLEKLEREKRTEELSSSPYYEWIFKTFDATKSGGSIKAVSVMDDLEWDDSPVEQKFLEKNTKAAERGVKVERVFIMEDDIYVKALKNRAVSMHKVGNKYGLNGFIASKSHLLKTDMSLVEAAGDGFIIVNDSVVLIDKFGPNGDARGIVTMNPDEVDSYSKIFKRIMNKSGPLGKFD